jgi:phosphoglycolate phosphatase-like HAD superfamily hydrolase
MTELIQPVESRIIRPSEIKVEHFLADFDGTVANTLEKIPGGVSVEQAYGTAMARVFGDLGRRAFEEVKGLQNRGPVELLHDAVEGRDVSEFVALGSDFLNKYRSDLEGYVPPGLGASLDFKDPILSLSELLVREKLRILTEQIGKRLKNGNQWPEACEGFPEFYRELGNTDIRFGVISSGHHKFIRQCFELWGLEAPELIISDDIMRSPSASHIPREERTKPSVGPFRMAVEQDRTIKKTNSVYIGDAARADGGMAQEVGVPFILFKRNPEVLVEDSNPVLEIEDWTEVGRLINDSGELIIERSKYE